MHRGWRGEAEQARSVLAATRHGTREKALEFAFKHSRWKSANTLRRAIAALEFLDQLERDEKQHFAYIAEAPYSVVEILARWYRFDPNGALEAARDWAVGKQSVHDLAQSMKAARSNDHSEKSGPVLESEYRDRAESEVTAAIQSLLGRDIGQPEVNVRQSEGHIRVDYRYLLKPNEKTGRVETLAAIIVGPYQNTSIYQKRRLDWVLRAFGLAWMYDHVVLVLPQPACRDSYSQCISRYLKEAARRRSGPTINAPHVHIVALDLPLSELNSPEVERVLKMLGR